MAVSWSGQESAPKVAPPPGPLTALVGVLLLTAALSAGLLGLARPARAGTASWQWPLAGSPRVVAGYVPVSAFSGGHPVADLAGKVGEPVRAAGAGWVVLVTTRLVVVAHVSFPDSSLRTSYQPVLPTVPPGSWVRAGQQIGLLSGSDRQQLSGPALLHWGLLQGRWYLDPLQLLRPTAPRLLPLHGSALAAAPVARAAGSPSWTQRLRSPMGAGSAALALSGVAVAGLSRAGRRASRAAAGPPWCASGRSGFP